MHHFYPIWFTSLNHAIPSRTCLNEVKFLLLRIVRSGNFHLNWFGLYFSADLKLDHFPTSSSNLESYSAVVFIEQANCSD